MVVVGLKMMRDDSNLTTEKRTINKNCFLQHKLQTNEANTFVSQKENLLITAD